MTPLVLLPGHMCDARQWAPQVAALSAARTVVLPLLDADSMEAMAASVLASAPPRFALAGLSMGGIVAMEVVRQSPARVERLALLDTNPLPEAEAVRAQRRERMARVASGHLAEVMRDEMKPLYLADGPGKGALLDLCLDMALLLGPDTFARQSRALMGRPDSQATLRAYKGPTLLLQGAEDRLVPPARHDLMASLMPHAVRVTVPGAGHLPPLERPEDTNRALAAWLG